MQSQIFHFQNLSDSVHNPACPWRLTGSEFLLIGKRRVLAKKLNDIRHRNPWLVLRWWGSSYFHSILPHFSLSGSTWCSAFWESPIFMFLSLMQPTTWSTWISRIIRIKGAVSTGVILTEASQAFNFIQSCATPWPRTTVRSWPIVVPTSAPKIFYARFRTLVSVSTRGWVSSAIITLGTGPSRIIIIIISFLEHSISAGRCKLFGLSEITIRSTRSFATRSASVHKISRATQWLSLSGSLTPLPDKCLLNRQLLDVARHIWVLIHSGGGFRKKAGFCYHFIFVLRFKKHRELA